MRNCLAFFVGGEPVETFLFSLLRSKDKLCLPCPAADWHQNTVVVWEGLSGLQGFRSMNETIKEWGAAFCKSWSMLRYGCLCLPHCTIFLRPMLLVFHWPGKTAWTSCQGSGPAIFFEDATHCLHPGVGSLHPSLQGHSSHVLCLAPQHCPVCIEA